ncbi:DegT/DnrJ/EryC1/StrS aminotransferase family protein [candidate division KSB1 bacterium]|nr:DegT/DnrJ/EryC1/StrS aminotransferase family protein [candidate division KSB1 bacterium]
MFESHKTSINSKVKLNRGIGSEFWLPSKYVSNKNSDELANILPDGKKQFVTSGREAIFQIIRSIGFERQSVLVPAYLDWTVIDPYIRTNTNFKYYKVKENLNIDLDDIKAKLNDDTKAIVVIHYFGFLQSVDVLKNTKKNLIVLEDTTHSILSQHQDIPSGSFGDISYAGFRKLLPIPDCAVICYNNDRFSIPDLDEQDLGHLLLREKRTLGLYYSGKYVERGDEFSKRLAHLNFNLAEELIQLNYSKPCKTSENSACLLTQMRFSEIIQQRIKNFTCLLEQDLGKATPFYNYLPEGICPLGFPIISDKRDELRQYLISKKIYPPIHWILPNSINKEEFSLSWEISGKILTIPIDQRYDESHMHYIAKTLKEFD